MTHIRNILLVVSLVFVGLGCADDSKPESKGCTVDTECKGDRICVSGACQSPFDVEPADMQNTRSDMGEDVLRPPQLDFGPGPDLTPLDMSFDLGCPDGYVYNPVTGECFLADCTAESDCPLEEYCDLTTARCLELECTTLEIDCPGTRPYLDPETCLCVGCVGDSECSTGEVCQAGICEDLACESTCDPNMPSSCATGDYCVRGCCVACIGSADCGLGEVCSLGACIPSPDCSQDPTICPEGTTCSNGACLTDGGPTCASGCPADSYCGQNGNCQPETDPDCGGCNSDCSCPNGLECKGNEMGVFCFGCSNIEMSKTCPMGQICLDGSIGLPVNEAFCLPGGI